MTNTEMDNNFDNETEETNFEYTSEWLKQNTKIRGGAFLLLCAIICSGLSIFVNEIRTFNTEDVGGNFFLIASEIISMFSMLGVAIYTVYLFINRRPNSIFWGRCYCVFLFLESFVWLLIYSYDKLMVSCVLLSISGFLVLFLEDVQEIIPKSFRKISKFDWGLLAGIVLIQILFGIIGAIQLGLSGYYDY